MKKALSCITIFWGAFLLFGVQPMVGSTLLPVFGGTAAVWTVCLASFQILLLVGYFYAHAVEGRASRGAGTAGRRRPRCAGHLALVFAGAAWAGVVAFNRSLVLGWAGDGSFPAAQSLLAVLLLVGLPYTLLSSNSSLVQAWSVEDGDGRRHVYRLYAVSNAGSFCGLLAYPLAIEPFMPLRLQWAAFAAGLAVYGVLLAWLARCVGRERAGRPSAPCNGQEVPRPGEDAPSSGGKKAGEWEWLGLSAFSCFLLNGVTAHLCNDVTPLPLLWAVLLALYLASYIVGFTDRGARWGKWTFLPVAAVAGLAVWHLGIPTGRGYAWELTIGASLIFLGGWMVHGRLYGGRPGTDRLTRYYLVIALGGALGGTAASLVFPFAFSFVAEYPVALVLLIFLAILELHARFVRWGAGRLDWRVMCGILAVVAAFAYVRARVASGKVVLSMRNFYGTGRVLLEHMNVPGTPGYDAHVFEHAGVMHGFEPVEPRNRGVPTLCFTPHAGGLSIESHPKYKSGEPMRVAVAGMGVATLAAYARPGDEYRFYEINPQVAELARNTNLFWYVSGCKGRLDIVVDDARRALERERERGEQKWDVLVVDVFSGDSIPPHMSTREAVELYLERLAPGGILSFHLTNWHLGLSPMVKAIAREFGLHLQGFGCWADRWSHGSYWTFLTREPCDFYIKGRHGRVDYGKVPDIELMTDERHSLLPYLSLDPMPKFGE